MIREVGSGKPYATIQAALDALYIAQGVAPFTETQTIRVFNGTYTETVTPHGNLTPTATFRLVLEAAVGNTPIIDGQSIRAYGIYNNINSYVTVNGFTIHHCTSYGIYFNSSPFALLTNNIAYSCGVGIYSTNGMNPSEMSYNTVYSNSGTYGMGLNDGGSGSLIHHNISYSNTNTGIGVNFTTQVYIYNNTCYNNGYYGINLQMGTACKVYSNITYGNTQTNLIVNSSAAVEIYLNNIYNGNTGGIYINGGANGSKIYRNKINGNKGVGMKVYNFAGIKIYNNLIYLNNDFALNIEKVTSAEVYNNTIYMCDGGITLYNIATGATIKNNIVWDFWDVCINLSVDSQPSFVSDYNDLFGAGGSYVGRIGSTYYYTLALWKVASGQDANSISLNAKFQDVNGEIINSLKIIDLSPCASSGADLSAIFTDDYDGTIRTIPFSMGCYAKTYIYHPIISGQALDFYLRTEDQNVIASANINGTPTIVYIVVNGKSFLLSYVSGILYSATISARAIGICANKTIEFFAENIWGTDYNIAPSNLTVTAGVISKPTIINQVLSKYNPTQDEIITATANVSGNPDNVVVKMNGKSFVMTLTSDPSGTQYRAIIPAYQIGLCINQVVVFMATNNYDGVDEYAPSNITVSANGNYDIAIIETAIINLITTYCPAIKTALNYEPKLIPELPAITLWYDGFDQTQTEAVSYTINHKWIMRLYVRLNDAKIAQDEVKALTKSILSAFKSDLNLSRTVLKETIPSAIVSAVLDQNNAVLIVEFNTTTMTEED